jgi:hypothetical protein
MQLKFLVAVASVLLVITGWFFRWEIAVIPNGQGTGIAYMLNRWTGSVYAVIGKRRIKVEDEFWVGDKKTE